MFKFSFFLSHYLCLVFSFGNSLRKVEKGEEKNTLTWILNPLLFCAKHFFFFHHLLIYFPVRHPISLLHKNHTSFEALKLVFWFSVGKDKIHVGYCWNKMYIWDSGILWFFFFFFGSNDHGWVIAFVLLLV